jgi:hypothetical protein
VVRLVGKKESEPEFRLPLRLDSSDEDEDPFGPNRHNVCGFGKSAKDETGRNWNKTKFSKMPIFSVFACFGI